VARLEKAVHFNSTEIDN